MLLEGARVCWKMCMRGGAGIAGRREKGELLGVLLVAGHTDSSAPSAVSSVSSVPTSCWVMDS